MIFTGIIPAFAKAAFLFPFYLTLGIIQEGYNLLENAVLGHPLEEHIQPESMQSSNEAIKDISEGFDDAPDK